MAEWRVDVDPTGEDMASAALTAVVAEQSALRRVAELAKRSLGGVGECVSHSYP